MKTQARLVTRIFTRILFVVALSALIPQVTFAADVTSGLVALWRFDEASSTVVTKDYVSGISATFRTQPTFLPSKIANGVSFDGRTALAIATSSSLSNLNKVTITSWVKPYAYGGGNGASNIRIVTKSSPYVSATVSNARKFGFHITPQGYLGLTFGFTGTVGSWNTTTVVPLNEWHQVAMTYDANDLSVAPLLYIDGVAQSVVETLKPSGVPYTDDSVLLIGDNPNTDGSISSRDFNGGIDQLRIYNRVLTSTEIANVYKVENPNYGLVMHWKFSEGQGLSTVDTLAGTVGTFSSTPTWVSGKLGSGLSLSSTRAHPIVNTGTYGNSNTITLSSWIYLRSYGGSDGLNNSRILTKGTNTTGQRRYGFHVDKDGALGFLAGYTSQGSWRTAPNTIALNTWYQVTVTYSFDTPNVLPVFYVNGVAKPVATTLLTPSGTPFVESDSLYVGDNPNADGSASTRSFNGVLDEIRMYNRVLAPSEISDLYKQDNRPNIIVIMTDDQDDMGSMDVMTKTKTLIQNVGVTFKNSFVSFSLCCPSRSGFLTGQYPHNNGVYGNTDGYAPMLAQEGDPLKGSSLPVWLKDAGYDTALIGKYINRYGDNIITSTTFIPAGWTEWQGMPDALGLDNYYGFSINHNGVIKKYGTSTADYQTDVLAEGAAQYISTREPGGKPFFIWLTPFAPHFGSSVLAAIDDGSMGPFPAERHKGKFASVPLPTTPNMDEADVSDKPLFVQNYPRFNASSTIALTKAYRARRETLLAVDDMVEKVVNTLQAKGMLDNTIIVFTSDNGFSQGEHRRLRGKRVLYEESIRVPLAIRGPGFSTGETRTQLVNNLDIVATIVEQSGATPLRPLDGRSLTTVLKDKNTPWRTALLVEGRNDGIAPITPGDFFQMATDDYFNAVRTPNFVLSQYGAFKSSVTKNEFYDLSKDPYQLVNKQGDVGYSTKIAALTSTLNTLKNCKGTECYVTTPEPSVAQSPRSLLFAQLSKIPLFSFYSFGGYSAQAESLPNQRNSFYCTLFGLLCK